MHYELARLHRVGRLSQIDKSNYENAVNAGMAEKEDFDEVRKQNISWLTFFPRLQTYQQPFSIFKKLHMGDVLRHASPWPTFISPTKQCCMALHSLLKT